MNGSPRRPSSAGAETGSSLKALVFDVDGTLYRQGPLRRAMLGRLARAHAAHPLRGWQTLRVLRAYRRAQEELRTSEAVGGIAGAQIALTCERTNVARDSVLACVARWMEDEPLPFLSRCLQPGVAQFLASCRARGLRLAALSDYPPEAKLQALGLSESFDLVLSAQSPEVNVFKPNPRGLLLALQRLGVDRSEAIYVGDRADVDAPTAEAAGVRCAILAPGASPATGTARAHISISGFAELEEILWPSESARRSS